MQWKLVGDDIEPEYWEILVVVFVIITRIKYSHIGSLCDDCALFMQELLMSGLPEIDIVDWEKNTEYSNYTEDSQIVKVFHSARQ